MKRCRSCGEEKPVGEFHPTHARCKGCLNRDRRERRIDRKETINQQQRAHYAGNKDRYRAYHRKAAYGITADEFERLRTEQEGRCAICGDALVFGGKDGTHVDHCHTDAHVRGLLCSGCNLGIGHLRDNPALMRAAAAYVETH